MGPHAHQIEHVESLGRQALSRLEGHVSHLPLGLHTIIRDD
jgi:hypothetical protein